VCVCTRGASWGSLLGLDAISSDYRRLRSAGDDSWSQPRYSLTWYIAISRIPYDKRELYCYRRSSTLVRIAAHQMAAPVSKGDEFS
jgi:hypothetical protein